MQTRIKSAGPLRLDEYIRAALWDEAEGYYATRRGIGRAGDFITAPEVSQIFGEIIGLWCIQAWQDLGCPERFTLLELGAGNGTLMRDIWRVAQFVGEFSTAANIAILERSAPMRERQQEQIDAPIRFLDDIAELDTLEGPLIIIANEFFDALPIRQFQSEGGGWLECFVGEGLKPLWLGCPAPPRELAAYQGEIGVIEFCEEGAAIARSLGGHVAKHGGEALIIDYGEWDGIGDTLQAIGGHELADPFSNPGAHDITAHIRFRDLAEASGLAHSFSTQGEFLDAHGGRTRMEALAAANPELAEELQAGYARLSGKSAMGELFKVLVFNCV